MEGIMTVREMIEELEQLPQDAPVMIAVIKYPEEFQVKVTNGNVSWTESTTVECHPLEAGEITVIDGIVHVAVELMDYDEQRHFAGG